MLIYDGDCAFCTRSARWIGRRLPAGTRVVPWQALPDLGALGLTRRDVSTAAYWIDRTGRVHRGYRAVALSLVAAGGRWALVGRLLLVPPVNLLAMLAYRLVAANRHRLPGGTGACRADVAGGTGDRG